MKDNEANTRQNNGKNLFTNGNYFSQLVIDLSGKNLVLTADTRGRFKHSFQLEIILNF
jgi:hypothetical protein